MLDICGMCYAIRCTKCKYCIGWDKDNSPEDIAYTVRSADGTPHPICMHCNNSRLCEVGVHEHEQLEWCFKCGHTTQQCECVGRTDA